MLIPSNTTYATDKRDYRILEEETERGIEADEVTKVQSQNNKRREEKRK